MIRERFILTMMTRITFCLEEDLKKRLEQKARAERRSVSNVINLCLEEYLSKEEKPIAPGTAATLSALIIEDSSADVELLLRALRKSGYDPRPEIVATPQDMQHAITLGGWDIILSDWELPGFSGMDALQLHRRSGGTAPFIIVSGRIGEEAAVAAIRSGADDYIPKDRLDKLGPVIERVLAGASRAGTTMYRRGDLAHS